MGKWYGERAAFRFKEHNMKLTDLIIPAAGIAAYFLYQSMSTPDVAVVTKKPADTAGVQPTDAQKEWAKRLTPAAVENEAATVKAADAGMLVRAEDVILQQRQFISQMLGGKGVSGLGLGTLRRRQMVRRRRAA